MTKNSFVFTLVTPLTSLQAASDSEDTVHRFGVCCRLTIHQLAARSVIRSLEQEERAGGADTENIRKRIVELSVQAGVSSVHTAFISVNKDSKQKVKGPLLQRRVPTGRKFTDSVCV